jgi:TonB family protein
MGIFSEILGYFRSDEEGPESHLPFVNLRDIDVVSSPNPEDFYPAYCRLSGEFGRVRLILIVRTDGVVRSVWVKNSCGFERLDQAAMSLAMGCRFKAYFLDSIPREFSTSIEVEFRR